MFKAMGLPVLRSSCAKSQRQIFSTLIIIYLLIAPSRNLPGSRTLLLPDMLRNHFIVAGRIITADTSTYVHNMPVSNSQYNICAKIVDWSSCYHQTRNGS